MKIWGVYVDATIFGAIIGAVAGIAGAVIGAIVAWCAAISTNALQKSIAENNLTFQKELAASNERFHRRTSIEAMILKLSEYAMQWPTVEKDDYCKAYPGCPGDSNGKERYENYCSYLFNTLNAIFDFCDQDAAKVKEMFGVEEMVKRHWRCWDGDKGNLSYDQKFRAYVHSVIDDLKRRKEIT